MTQEPQNILVIRLSALGDIMLSLGAMQAIRRHHPAARITLLTTRAFVDLAQRSRYFDRIIVDPRPAFYQAGKSLSLLRQLRGEKYDRVYDLQMNDRTRFYRHVLRGRPAWIGDAKGAAHYYDPRDGRRVHAFDRYREMLSPLGIDVTAPDLSWMQTDVSIFGLKKPYVLLVPGSAPQHPEKRWPAARYGGLAARLSREGFDVAVLGTAAERDVIDRVVKSCPAAQDLSGRTSFYDIASLAMEAAGIIGNDTGPMHVAALAGAPALSLFSGETDPQICAPVGATVIQSDDISDITVADVMRHFSPGMAA